MIDTKRPLRVFLCHATDDKPAVTELYKRLIKDGVDAWLDKEKLIPGQEWQIEIPKAVKNSDVVIVCLSSQSVTKEGYVQKEIKFALDAADEKPDGTIFIIPARLENCVVPERIGRFHWVDLYSSDGYELLLKALRLKANVVFESSKTESPTDQTGIEKQSVNFIEKETPLVLANKKLKQKLQDKPLLLIGLGGAGQLILNYLASTFDEALQKNKKTINRSCSFITIDTLDTFLNFEKNNKIDHINLGADVSEFVRARYSRKSDPNLLKWLDWDLFRTLPRSALNICVGSGSIRQIGRLALYYDFASGFSRVKKAINNAVISAKNNDSANSPNVVIISSICGGTGSGILIDIAYLTLSILKSHYLRTGDIVGALILPRVFTEKDDSTMQFNSYQTIMDLEQFSKDIYEFGPSNETIQFENIEPFSKYWLIDATINRIHNTEESLIECGQIISSLILENTIPLNAHKRLIISSLEQPISLNSVDASINWVDSYNSRKSLK